jgi:hypothetical protein
MCDIFTVTLLIITEIISHLDKLQFSTRTDTTRNQQDNQTFRTNRNKRSPTLRKKQKIQRAVFKDIFMNYTFVVKTL